MKSLFLPLALATTLLAADPPEPKFEAVTIDAKIQIGYGVAVADVDGDKLPDILLADKKQFVWYRNPGPGAGLASEKAAASGAWQKFVIAENLTKNDNVCLAAQDIDGDGKCEVAVGAEWNPGDTENSGAVFYLIAPADRTQPWTPVKLHAEPTTHRMRWMQLGKDQGGRKKDDKETAPSSSVIPPPSSLPQWGLVVVPLHGRGNKNGEGAGVKVLLYLPPAQLNDPKGEWKTELIDESMHMTHNFDIWPQKRPGGGLLVGGKEGAKLLTMLKGKWSAVIEGLGRDTAGVGGAGEARVGRFNSKGALFYALVQPMHGNSLAVFIDAGVHTSERILLTDKLTEGHALGCGDLLGAGADQIVVGWRGTPGKEGSTHGVALWTSLDPQGEKWRESVVDAGGMACEDLQLADLDGDGKLDIVASGRATRNVKVYFNKTGG